MGIQAFREGSVGTDFLARTGTVHQLLPLQLLLRGQAGSIEQVCGPDDQVHRLHEMGLRCGAEVEMLQSGSPCIISLAGHRLCLRTNEGMHVLVNVKVSA